MSETEVAQNPIDINYLKKKLVGKPFEGFRDFQQFDNKNDYWTQRLLHPDLGYMSISKNQMRDGTTKLISDAEQHGKPIIVVLDHDKNVKDIRLKSFYD